MRAPGTIHLASLSLLAASGCSLLVSAQLSDKPSEADAAGGSGGQGSSSGQTSSSQTSSSQTSSSQTSSSSGMTCPGGMTTCLGHPGICDVNLMSDDMNCGACDKICFVPTHCKQGMCSK